MELSNLIKPLSPPVFTKRLPGKYVRCRVKRYVTRCQSGQTPRGACRRKLLIGTLVSLGLLQRESKADEVKRTIGWDRTVQWAMLWSCLGLGWCWFSWCVLVGGSDGD